MHAMRVAMWLFFLLGGAAAVEADDPLNAFPTSADSTDDRVKRLTDAEREAIRTPEQGEKPVFIVARGLLNEGRLDATAEAEPWLRVFPDGNIDCQALMIANAERCKDKLTKSELDWLMHLAVNECGILKRSTNDVEADFRVHGQKSAWVKGLGHGEYFRYDLAATSGENDLQVREAAIMVRPVRARMKLNAFASLHKYVYFLVSRAYLGDLADRNTLLDELNAALKIKEPNVPAFRMDHLAGASTTDNVELFANFQQELALEEAKLKRVTGIVVRKLERRSQPSPSKQWNSAVCTLDFALSRRGQPSDPSQLKNHDESNTHEPRAADLSHCRCCWISRGGPAATRRRRRRDPHTAGYVEATELPDGEVPPVDANGNFIVGPTHKPAPEMAANAGVPAGRVVEFTMESKDSKIYPGIARERRDVWDARSERSGEAVVTTSHRGALHAEGGRVCADGVRAGDGGAVYRGGGWAGELLFTALDNLIHQKRVPAMVAISIGNGSGDAQGSQRGLEYDTMSGRYAEFVETEVLPLVEEKCGVKLTKDPDGRATMGCSSGASCALAMAWYRPDLYHRVLTYSGTYVNQQWPPNAETPHGAWEFHER